MNKNDQIRLAENFRRRHQAPPLLLLPNAWDAISARIVEAAGFDAIATTSAGVAWALGYTDGEAAPWSEVVAATGRIVRAVRVPVTVDIEAGYGETPAQVATSIAAVIQAGAVGINIEDGTSRPGLPIRSIDDAVARIRAARDAAATSGVPLVINARIDLYLKHIGDERTRFAETVQRAAAYMAAGADCIFPFGLVELETIAELVKAIRAPINIVGRPGTPPVNELTRVGVARVSTAAGLTLATLSLVRQLAGALRAEGRFDVLASAMTRVEVHELLAARPEPRA